MANTTQPLIIKNWKDGMGDSPDVGFALIQNASIDAVPGAVMPNYRPILNSFPTNQSSAGTFSGGVFTLNAPTTALQTDGIAVTFSTTSSLPSGLVAGTVYFLYQFATGEVIVASTLGNALSHSPLSISGNGSGTITVTSVDMGTPHSIAQSGGVTYVADSNGRVWYSEGSQTYLLNGNTITNGTGHGLATFTNSDPSSPLTFLFVWRNHLLDVCDVTTQAKRRDPVGNSSWTSGWQTLNSATGYSGSHLALLGYDNIVYACDGRYINAIQEVPGKVFAPGDSTTYSWNSQALALPGWDTATCLEQQGQNLMIGGGAANQIYPWDRISPSFGLPILCPEIGVYGLKNIGNVLWILNGTRGIIYNTIGYLVSPVRKLPENILQGTSGGSNLVTWGGVGAKNGAFIFGVQPLNTAYSAVYLLYPDGRLVIDNTPSQGAALPTVLSLVSGEFYFTGYAGGLDFTSTNRYSAFPGTIVQSQLYTVGKKVNKATYSLLECQLNQPGASGGQVRISYRTAVTGSWTVLATYTLDGTTTSFDSDIGLTNIENIQVQVEVATNGTGSNAARVREVRLW